MLLSRRLIAWTLLTVPCTALAAAPARPPQVTASAVGLLHPDVPQETFDAVMRAVAGELKQNPRLDFKDRDTRLAEFAQDLPQDEITAARQAYKDGQQALLELDLDKASQLLGDAVQRLTRVLPHIKKQELADAMALRAVVLAEADNSREAKKQFVRLLVWRSDYIYDTTLLPPRHLALFEEAQKEASKLKSGIARITSTPDGAQAFIDGKYIGLTPCTASKLAVGEHYITLKKEGFLKAVTPVTVVARRESRSDTTLRRNDKYLLVEQAIQSLDQSVGSETAPTEMGVFADVLLVDHIVLIRARASGTDAIEVTGYLYDLRSKRLLAQMQKSFATAELQSEVEALTRSLYLNVDYEGQLAKPKEAALPKQVKRRPIWKTWWLWTAVGVVAGAAVGTGVGIAATQAPSCPTGSVCPILRF